MIMNKIKIKLFDCEIELEGDDNFIKKHLDDFYKRINTVSTPKMSINSNMDTPIFSPPISAKGLTPAEFYKKIQHKGKSEGVNQILIFGKYLGEVQEITEFSQKEVNSVLKEAKLSKPIHGQYFTNAVKQGLLRPIGQGKYSLTLSAETAISNMQ
jgi:hypothetical protein